MAAAAQVVAPGGAQGVGAGAVRQAVVPDDWVDGSPAGPHLHAGDVVGHVGVVAGDGGVDGPA